MQLKSRFESFRDVCDTFEFLKLELMIKPEETEIIKWSLFKILNYKSYVGSELTCQILSLKKIIKNKQLCSIRDLAQFILENYMSCSYS